MYKKLTEEQLRAGFDIPPLQTNAREYANVIYWQVKKHVEHGLYLGAVMIAFSSVDFMSGTKKKNGDKKFVRWIDTYMPEYVQMWGDKLERGGLSRPSSEDIWDLRCAMFHETSGTEFGFHAGLYENLVFITNQTEIEVKSLIDAPAFIRAFQAALYNWVADSEEGKAEYQPFVYPFAVVVQEDK